MKGTGNFANNICQFCAVCTWSFNHWLDSICYRLRKKMVNFISIHVGFYSFIFFVYLSHCLQYFHWVLHPPSFLAVFQAIFSLAYSYCMLDISITGFIYSFATYRLASNDLQTSATTKFEQSLFRCTSREFCTDNCLLEKCTMRKKCPYSELFWSVFFPHLLHLDLIRRERQTLFTYQIIESFF